MTLLWRDGLSVGNDVIDSDHKYLIDIVNRVERCLGTRDLAQLTDALENLENYSKTHFRREEKIANAVGYDKVAQLHASHAALLERLAALRQEIGDTWTDSAVEHFASLLKSWLLNHVIKEDLLMRPALAKFPKNFDPQ
jgi:hemerythrin